MYDIFSGLLDVARRAYTEIVDDITCMSLENSALQIMSVHIFGPVFLVEA